MMAGALAAVLAALLAVSPREAGKVSLQPERLERRGLRLLDLDSLMGCHEPGMIPPLCEVSMFTSDMYIPPAFTLEAMRDPSVQARFAEHSESYLKSFCSLPPKAGPLTDGAKTTAKLYYTWAETMVAKARVEQTRLVLRPSMFASNSTTYRPFVDVLPDTLGGAENTPIGGCNNDGSFSAWQAYDVTTR